MADDPQPGMMSKYFGYFLKYKLLDLVMYCLYWVASYFNRQYCTLAFKLKCHIHGVGCGKYPRVWGRFLFNKFPGSVISIGNNLVVMSDPRYYALNVYPQSAFRTLGPNASIIVGDGVSFNSINIVARSQSIVIGDYTMIGGNCQIMDTDFHPVWPPENRGKYAGNALDRPIHIGKNVFIGVNVLVLKGVTIGDNSVIAAGSVVNRAIPANCMAAGVPARVIKTFENTAGS